jgi:hypothetical protein
MGKLCWLEQCSFAEQRVFMFSRISLESAWVYRPYHFSDRKVSPCLDQPLVSLRVSQMVKTWFLVLRSSWTVFSVKHEVSWRKVECSKLSNVSIKISVAIFRVNILCGRCWICYICQELVGKWGVTTFNILCVISLTAEVLQKRWFARSWGLTSRRKMAVLSKAWGYWLDLYLFIKL